MREYLLLFCLIISPHFPSVNPDSQPAPALYVFGDSLLDSGNNNMLPTLARANFKPYGFDFSGGATGRFTNGKTVADFIAEFLGLPPPPPYMSFRLSTKLTGMNYASGSCGILPKTGKFIGKCLDFNDQIDLFAQTVKVELLKHHHYTKDVSNYLSKSIFLVSMGSNDYINNYLQPNLYASSKRYSPKSFSKLLTNRLSHKLERLYRLGARKLLVFEVGPIGCIPSIKIQYKYNGQCIENINKIASLFNYHLGTMVQNLASTLPGSAIFIGHVHRLAHNVILNPSRYGLTDTSNPCCITWANGTSGCIPELLPCTNPDKHIFWDGFHLTEAGYSVIAAHCLNGTSVCGQTNIKQLVQI